MKPFKSKIRLAVSALILIVAVVAVSCLTTGCSDDKSEQTSELEQQIKAKEQEILKLQSDQNQLIGMYNQLESNQVSSQVAPNYQQEGTYQPAPAQPSTVVVQPSESHSDSALTGGMAGFMLGHALGNLGNNGGGGGYNSGSRTVINKTIINHTPNITNTRTPSAVRLPTKPATQINKPTAPISRSVAPVSKPRSFTKSYSQSYSAPSKSYSFTRRR